MTSAMQCENTPHHHPKCNQSWPRIFLYFDCNHFLNSKNFCLLACYIHSWPPPITIQEVSHVHFTYRATTSQNISRNTTTSQYHESPLLKTSCIVPLLIYFPYSLDDKISLPYTSKRTKLINPLWPKIEPFFCSFLLNQPKHRLNPIH